MTSEQLDNTEVQQYTECENCGEQRYTYERCQHCGTVHWKEE